MIDEQIRLAVEEIVGNLLEKEGQDREVDIKFTKEHPIKLEHGDYSINVAMQLAKLLKRPPVVIAMEIKEKLVLQSEIAALFNKVDVVAPGFVNLHLDWAKWAALDHNQAVSNSAKKVLIEHTSINPNKSAHIGHLRNSCIGDTLARMLKRTGHQVEVHNYIDDLGNQLADTLVGIMHIENEQSFSRFGDYCWEVYALINKLYQEQPVLVEKRAHVLHELENDNSSTAWIGLLVAERIVREHVEEMKAFDIDYDVLVWESNIVREGFWSSAFELLKKTASVKLETQGKLAGCWVIADKVLIRSNGILTYTAKDIAYHLWKFGLLNKDFRYKRFSDNIWSTQSGTEQANHFGNAHTVINVIDHRQEYPQLMVKQALHALGFNEQAEQLKHVSYGVVSLSPNTAAQLGIDISDGKSSYPMSGRQGIGVKIAHLLDHMALVIDGKRSNKEGLSSRAIAAAAIRYFLLKYNLQTEVIFDIEQMTEVSGNTGVYLLYAYARSCRILEKAEGEADSELPGSLNEWHNLSNDLADEKHSTNNLVVEHSLSNLLAEEHSLLRQLAYWPETLHKGMEELAPHMLCTYTYELASLFNHFYAHCPILQADDEKKNFRIWLTRRYQKTLGDALRTLGLPTPTMM